MSELTIETENHGTEFVPGETIRGTVCWNLMEMPKSVALRLIWYTRGKGTEDVGIVDSVTFDSPAQYETAPFRFDLPAGPYSFSGKLIALIWALEAVVEPGDLCERVEITVSPTGKEIDIAAAGKSDDYR